MHRLAAIAMLAVTASGGLLAGGGPAHQDFVEFRLLAPYAEIRSSSFRVEDLTFETDGDEVRARFDIKNLSEEFLDPVLCIALFDKDRRLLAVGNYSAVMGFSGRQTSSERMGFEGDYGRKNVKFISLRLGLDR